MEDGRSVFESGLRLGFRPFRTAAYKEIELSFRTPVRYHLAVGNLISAGMRNLPQRVQSPFIVLGRIVIIFTR